MGWITVLTELSWLEQTTNIGKEKLWVQKQIEKKLKQTSVAMAALYIVTLLYGIRDVTWRILLNQFYDLIIKRIKWKSILAKISFK